MKLDTKTGIAEVSDDLTDKVTSGPVRGKIETFNDIRLPVFWRVKAVPRDPKLSYSPKTANELTQRLTVRTGGAAALVSMTAGQYMNNLREFSADVACTASSTTSFAGASSRVNSTSRNPSASVKGS